MWNGKQMSNSHQSRAAQLDEAIGNSVQTPLTHHSTQPSDPPRVQQSPKHPAVLIIDPWATQYLPNEPSTP